MQRSLSLSEQESESGPKQNQSVCNTGPFDRALSVLLCHKLTNCPRLYRFFTYCPGPKFPIEIINFVSKN